MADTLIDDTIGTGRATEGNWTVITGHRSVVGGSVPDEFAAERVLARAARYGAAGAVLSTLEIDPAAPLTSGSLLLAEPIEFDSGSCSLNALATARLGFAVSVLWQYDEVIISAVGPAGEAPTAYLGAVLGHERAIVVESYLKGLGAEDIAVRLDEPGAAPDRRVEIAVRRGPHRY
jgi:outer membrane protein OmpA-like peptidoglycan-associated protein